MEFTIECGELARILGCVKGVVPSRTTIPILNNALFDVGVGKVSIMACDMEMWASTSATVETVKAGRLAMPAAPLLALAKSLPKDKLATIRVDGERAHFQCGRSKYDLRTLPADEFPLLPGIDDGAEFSAPAASLSRALDLVKGTFDPSHSQAFYQGVWMLCEGGRLVLMAADGYRFSRVACDDIMVQSMASMLLPASAVREIGGIIAGAEGDVSIVASSRKIRAIAGGVDLTSRLLEATVPNYLKLVPSVEVPSIEIKAADLSDAIGRLAIVYSGVDIARRQPIAICKASNGILDISGGANDYGSEVVSASVNAPTTFGVSAQKLADASRMWPATSGLHISTQSGGPILITSPDVPDYMQVLMPMAITNYDRAITADAAQ